MKRQWKSTAFRTISILTGASPEFTDLIARLIDKNPATRIKWPVRNFLPPWMGEGILDVTLVVQELIVHPFWQVRLTSVPMPPEPMLEAFIAKYHLAPTGEEQFALAANTTVSTGAV